MKRYIINSPQIRANCANEIKHLMGEPIMSVTIEPYVDDQTDSQRSFFHVLVGILAKDQGVSPDAMKMDIKRECWGSDTVEVRGHEYEVVRSSTKAKKDEYSELIETAFRVGAFLGCVLPNPRYVDTK